MISLFDFEEVSANFASFLVNIAGKKKHTTIKAIKYKLINKLRTS